MNVSALNFFLSALPLCLLLFLILKKKPVTSFLALLIGAICTYIIRLVFFNTDPLILHAAIIDGFLSAWTPILIIWGAIFFFQTLYHSSAITKIQSWLKTISPHPIAQLMIIGWAFIFFIEGASGFGTPIALAAPLLVSLGFKSLPTLIFCLIMDTIPVSFGAIGAPTWFGFSNIPLTNSDILILGQKTAIIHFVIAFILPLYALRFLVSWKLIQKNIFFIFLSLLSCMVPYVFFSSFSTEFPSLLGGAIGLTITLMLARFHIGLSSTTKTKEKVQISQLWKALFPFLGIIILLLLTRLDFFGIKSIITNTKPLLQFGSFCISQGGVLQWNNILGTELSWEHAIWYVPSFIPFIVISYFSFFLLHIKKKKVKSIWIESFQRMKTPTFALITALLFVKLYLVGDFAPAFLLGSFLADFFGSFWILLSPFLGALGAFFSGSNTIANLTFGSVQLAAAQSLNIEHTVLLALHNIGGAAGNMISIPNIIAGCSILGLINQEGVIIRKTIFPLLIYCSIAGLLAFFSFI